MKRFFLFQLPAILYALLIFVFSAIPSLTPPFGFHIEDKFYHFAEFFIFSILLHNAFYSFRKDLFKQNPSFFSCLVGIFYAVLDEFHQRFVFNRSSDFFDFLADSLGVVSAQVVIWLYKKKKSNLFKLLKNI